DHDRAQQWQRCERKTNMRPFKVLRQDRSDLSASGCSGVHYECDENVHVSLHSMPNRTITRRNDDLKQISSDGDMGWYPEQIDHRRHANITGTAPKKSAKDATHERHEKDCPKRDRFDPGVGKTDHWQNLDPLNRLREGIESHRIMLCTSVFLVCAGLLHHSKRRPTLPGAKAGDGGEHNDRHSSYDRGHIRRFLQNFDCLDTHL